MCNISISWRKSAKEKLIEIIILSAVLWGGSMVLYHYLRLGLFLTLAITFGTTFYHFAIRLFIGYLISGLKKNNWNYQRRWFQQIAFEKEFYKRIKIKKWKRKMFTFNPDEFDLNKNSIESIVMATCQAEVVHEINILASFVPVLLSIWFGAAPVFGITSILGACYDLLFVMMQRYNRPRLLKLLAIKKNREYFDQNN